MRYELAYKPFPRGSGYGSFRTGIEDGLNSLGYPWEYVPLVGIFDKLTLKDPEDVEIRTERHKYKAWLDRRRMPDAYEIADTGPITRAGVARLCLDTPDRWAWGGAERRVGFTMFETSSLPVVGQYSWLPGLQAAQTVLVPSTHNVSLFSPYCQEVKAVPLAINADRFPYYDRTERLRDIRRGDRPFIFLLAGELSFRKGYDIALEAFGRVFPKRRDVWIVLKSRGLSIFMERRKPDSRQPAHGSPWLWEPDREAAPNVRLMRGDLSAAGMRRLYEIADCFVFPSRGEGYGLPPREAAATGMPVLCPMHTGMPDAKDWAYVIEHRLGGPACYNFWGEVGDYQEPSVSHTAYLMEWVYNNYEEALAFGKRAAAAVRQRSWEDVAREVVAATEGGR